MRTTEASALSPPPVSLRQKNFARVRLSILEIALDLSINRPFDELSIREIAERAGLSQGTFFNHFPTKQDVLFYFMRHWTLRAALKSRRILKEGGTAREAVTSIFALVPDEMERYPQVMLELISQIARASKPPEVDLSVAERLLAFPDEPEILEVETPMMEQLFTDCLKAAVKLGELPKSTPIKAAVEVLRAIFYGVPIATKGKSVAAVRRAYEEALALQWRGFSIGES